MATGKLPKSSRRAAHDETQGILLTIDSATTDVNKSAVQKNKPVLKTQKLATLKPQAKAPAPKKKQTASVKKKRTVKAQAPKLAATEPKAWDEILASANRTLKKDKNNKKAWADKIAALEAIGTDEALETLDDMAEAKPSLPAVHAARAKILVRQKDTMEAKAAWKRALALDPQNEAYKSGLAQLNAILLH